MSPRTQSSTSRRGRTAVTATALAAFVVIASAPAQELVKDIRSGDKTAITIACEELTSPDPEAVNGLLRVLQSGIRDSASERERVAAELAFSLVGWWSLRNVDIAAGLYDRLESNKWPKINDELLALASLGVADGPDRAERLLSGDDPDELRRGARMLRLVGGSQDVIGKAIATLLDDEDCVQAGLELIWEYEFSSEPLRKQLEAMHDASKDDELRYKIRWAMIRGGAFKTSWLLGHRKALPEDERHLLDKSVVQAADMVFDRLDAERARMKEGKDRDVVDRWFALRREKLESVAVLSMTCAKRLAMLREETTRAAGGWASVSPAHAPLILPRILQRWLAPEPPAENDALWQHSMFFEQRAMSHVGDAIEPAVPLLQWLAQRRPGAFRGWVAELPAPK